MGRSDPDLDAVGYRQVEELATVLSQSVNVVALHTSPLRRALNTAAAIERRCGVVGARDPSLAELDFGHAVELANEQAPLLTDGTTRQRPKLSVKTHHLYDPLPGGESLYDVWQRLRVFVTRVASSNDRAEGTQGTQIVVSHYRTLQLLEGMLLGHSFEDSVHHATFRPTNASATLVDPLAHTTAELWSPARALAPQ